MLGRGRRWSSASLELISVMICNAKCNVDHRPTKLGPKHMAKVNLVDDMILSCNRLTVN